MHRLAILYLVVLALPLSLLGCDGTASPVSPDQVAGLQQSDAVIRSSEDAVARPLSETSSGTLRPVGACSADVVAFEAEGRGRASHVGGFDIELSWCLDATTGEIGDGNATVVAANGDRIDMTLAGQAVSTTRLRFQAEIVGGSGRFAGAAGMLDIVAVLGESGSWTSDGTGWISY
jgi:hypothetical protein